MNITFSDAENTKGFCDMSYDDIEGRAAGLLAGDFGKFVMMMIFDIMRPLLVFEPLCNHDNSSDKTQDLPTKV